MKSMLRIVDDANLPVGQHRFAVHSADIKWQLPAGVLLLGEGPREVQGQQNLVNSDITRVQNDHQTLYSVPVKLQKPTNGPYKSNQLK